MPGWRASAPTRLGCLEWSVGHASVISEKVLRRGTGDHTANMLRTATLEMQWDHGKGTQTANLNAPPLR